jgi:hypothetical protein
MKKIKIADNFYQYQFLPRTEKQHFGFNIFVLVNGKDALLIDAAFADHASAVKDDLPQWILGQVKLSFPIFMKIIFPGCGHSQTFKCLVVDLIGFQTNTLNQQT